MDILVGFIVILLVVTVIGHGLWKLFSIIGRALFGPSKSRAVLSPPLPVAKPIDEFGITLGQLSKLRQAGLIDPAVHEQVIDALQRTQSNSIPVARVIAPAPEIRAEVTSPSVQEISSPLPLPAAHHAPTSTPQPVAATAIRAKPTKPWSEVLASFMQQNNIRWGELIGGLLIIGGSAALVASFWAEIAQRPVFKFSLFTAVTAALFGIGLYSEHRWKLPTTSRGVLLIATLLVPLNCVALAAFSSRGAPAGFTLGAQIVAIILFNWLLWLSAKVLAPQWPGLLTTGTMLLSAFMLVLRIVTPTVPTALNTFKLAAAPVALYVLLCALMLRTARRWKTIRAPAAEGIFLELGVFTFATMLGLLLLISQVGREATGFTFESISGTLRTICSVISAAGLPSLTAGLLVWQRAKGIRSNAIRIAGGAIAIIGGGVLLLGVGLAWPQPSAILPVAAFDFVTLLIIAFLYELPAVLCLSIPCLGIAWLVGFHVFAGHIAFHDASGATARVFLQPTSGTALAPFTVLLAIGSLLLRHRKRTYANIIGIMATLSGVLSLALLNGDGFGLHGDPYFATWIYLAFSLMLFITTRLIPLDWLVLPAWALAYAASAQFFVSRGIGHNPWGTSLLAWATVAAAALYVRRVRRRFTESPFSYAAYWIALAASLVGADMLGITRQELLSPDVLLALFWIAGLWFLVAVSARQLLVLTAAICFAITAGYFRMLRSIPVELSIAQMIQLLELNSTAISLTTLFASRFSRGVAADSPHSTPIAVKVQLSVACIFLALVIIPTTLRIAFDPADSAAAVGDLWTWLAAAALGAALFEAFRIGFREININAVVLSLLSFVALIACAVDHFDPMSWNAYHTLLAGCSAVGWLVVGYGVWIGSRLLGVSMTPISEPTSGDLTLSYHQPAQTPIDLVQTRAAMMFAGSRLQPTVIFWAIGIILGVVPLCARGATDDPAAPWWAVGAIVAVASLLPMLASWAYRPMLLYPATALLSLAASIWYVHLGNTLFAGNWFLDFAFLNLMMVALSGLAWLVLDVKIFSPAKVAHGSEPYCSAAIVPIGVIAVVTTFCLCAKAVSTPIPSPDFRLLAGALAPVVGLVTATLWQRTARQSLAMLYSVGLLVIAAAFAFSSIDAKSSAWELSITLAAYALFTATLWAARRHVASIARVVAIPVDARTWPVDWLIPINTFLVLITVAIAYWADLAFVDRLHRVAPATAGLAGAFALALLSIGNMKIGVRQSALGIFALSAVAGAWALMSPIEATMLDRAVAVFVVLSALSAIYLLLIPRLAPIGSAWISVAAGEGLHLGIIAGLAMLFSLGVEVVAYVTHSRAHISRIDIALLLLALVGTCVLLLIVAIRKKDLAGWIRSACVFAAEGTLALAFVHLRVTMPQLFGGVFAAYWPLVLMAIAFAGVGAAEALRRRYDAVLVRPIEQSGIFLPLLPVLAFWLAPPRSVDFAELLLTVAFFYGLVSALRRSFLFAIIGVLAANGAVWYLLQHAPGWGFTQHPQVWLIPGALAVLIAAQFNRNRMSAQQMRALRYACLLVIYASSTADVFLNGVAKQPWLPLLLAGLSVLGALLGIVLRIRPFLYLGTSFLAVSIVTMIHYASAQLHWTWIWYVAVILLGGGILILFGLFEKKRANMIGFVEGLRKWQ